MPSSGAAKIMEESISNKAQALRKDAGKENVIGLAAIFSFFVAALLFWFVSSLGLHWIVCSIISFLSFAVLFFIIDDHSLRPFRREAAKKEVKLAVSSHRAALLRNLERAYRKNDYGMVVSDTRIEKIKEFCESIGLPEGLLTPDELLSIIEGELKASPRSHSSDRDIGMVPVDPILFERWVAERLEASGWKARTTQGGADQGIDVIAEKHGVSVGIQCKLYSTAIGNKAVQEALSGIQYHGLSKGAVLTNASFTRSAIDLAHSAGIILMTHHDLIDPDAKLLPQTC